MDLIAAAQIAPCPQGLGGLCRRRGCEWTLCSEIKTRRCPRCLHCLQTKVMVSPLKAASVFPDTALGISMRTCASLLTAHCVTRAPGPKGIALNKSFEFVSSPHSQWKLCDMKARAWRRQGTLCQSLTCIWEARPLGTDTWSQQTGWQWPPCPPWLWPVRCAWFVGKLKVFRTCGSGTHR